MDNFSFEIFGINILIIITVFVIFTFLFMVMRWLVLWYWRVNEAVESLSYIAINLANINNSLKKIIERKEDKNKELDDTLMKIKKEENL